MSSVDSVSEALVLFLGYGVSSTPEKNSESIASKFGSEKAAELEVIVIGVINELNDIGVDWSKHDLMSAGVWVKSEMAFKHPWLTHEALNALEWAFTWWWR